ncbi:hypothetical protein ACTFIY_009887 [Dictyostelium cf. discoideum]
MDNNYNSYCSGQLKIISDFDIIQEIFEIFKCSGQLKKISDFDKIKEFLEIVLKNHANNQSTQNNNDNNNNFRILDIGCSHCKNSIIVLVPLIEQIRNKWEANEKAIKIFHSDLPVHAKDLPGFENYYKERLLNLLNNRYNELKVGGIFSFNLLIQEDHGSENEEKSKSSYYCMLNVKQILREMSYESIISREEVENMIIPIVHLTRNEYQYAIDKSTNNTGLKLIYENKITIKWSDIHQNDESYIGSIIAIIGNFIKNAINGDKDRVDSIFNDFKQRLHLKYKLNPKDFQFYVSNLYLSFLKEN